MATDCPICFLSGGTFQICAHRVEGEIVNRVHPDLFHLHCLQEIRNGRCPMCRDVMILPNENHHALHQAVQSIRRAVGPLLTMSWWKNHLQQLADVVHRVAGSFLTMIQKTFSRSLTPAEIEQSNFETDIIGFGHNHSWDTVLEMLQKKNISSWARGNLVCAAAQENRLDIVQKLHKRCKLGI